MTRLNRLEASSAILFLSILLSFILISCGNDESPADKCVPASARIGLDSVAYLYDGDRIAQIQIWSTIGNTEKYIVQYSGDKIAKVYVDYPAFPATPPPLQGRYYQFTYGENGKPEVVKNFHTADDTEAAYVDFFFYDDQGRLEKKDHTFSGQSLIHSTRYEYSDDNNVSRIFYTSTLMNFEERLGVEHHSFDGKPRFYAASPELSILEIYIFNFEPSVNNVLSFTLSGEPTTIFVTPVERSRVYEYDGKNISAAYTLQAGSSIRSYLFKDMTYSCHH